MASSELRLFVIEDNIGDFILVQEALDKYGITARLQLCQDGEAALKELSQLDPANLPDLIIVDLNLPRINGMQLLRHVRASRLFDRTPVMIFTSSESAEDRNEAERSGANAYFTKPSTLDDFLSTVGTTVRDLTRGSRSPTSGAQQGLHQCKRRTISAYGRVSVKRGARRAMHDHANNSPLRIPR